MYLKKIIMGINFITVNKGINMMYFKSLIIKFIQVLNGYILNLNHNTNKIKGLISDKIIILLKKILSKMIIEEILEIIK